VADDAVNRKHGKWNSRGEPKLSAQVLWPTPVASDTSSRSKPYAQGGTPLSLAVKWPTPTVCGNYNKAGLSAKSGDGLATAVKNWPTPTATLGTKGGRVTPQKSREGGTLIEAVSSRTWRTPNTVDAKGGTRRPGTDSQVQLCHQVGGSLNPMWVEWLMGWPLGWTDLKPLATDKFRQWQQQHGGCSVSPESPALQDEPTTA
jgi:hypothetical protein